MVVRFPQRLNNRMKGKFEKDMKDNFHKRGTLGADYFYQYKKNDVTNMNLELLH